MKQRKPMRIRVFDARARRYRRASDCDVILDYKSLRPTRYFVAEWVGGVENLHRTELHDVANNAVYTYTPRREPHWDPRNWVRTVVSPEYLAAVAAHA